MSVGRDSSRQISLRTIFVGQALLATLAWHLTDMDALLPVLLLLGLLGCVAYAVGFESGQLRPRSSRGANWQGIVGTLAQLITAIFIRLWVEALVLKTEAFQGELATDEIRAFAITINGISVIAIAAASYFLGRQLGGLSTRPSSWIGLSSAVSIFGVPLGSWWCRGIDDLATPERFERGCVLILPGIEGRSALNLDLARGLADGGVACGIEIFDWTSGWIGWSLVHLRDRRRHIRESQRLAERIRKYQQEYPGRPLYLIGHSGGTGIILRGLELLSPEECVTSAIFLASAVSPTYDLRPALRHIEGCLHSFYSQFNWFQLRLGTQLLGTIDGVHSQSAGAVAFRPVGEDEDSRQLYKSRLRQHPFRWSMAKCWNFAGHLGCTNRAFAAKWLAPLVTVGE